MNPFLTGLTGDSDDDDELLEGCGGLAGTDSQEEPEDELRLRLRSVLLASFFPFFFLSSLPPFFILSSDAFLEDLGSCIGLPFSNR